jgi:hypothetical protein
MQQWIRLLLMPELSTSAGAGSGFFAHFLLAAKTVRDSFKSSDDRDEKPPGHEG